MNSKNKYQNTKRFNFKCLLICFLLSNSLMGQVQVNWGVDVFPLDVCNHIAVNLDNKFVIGIEGEIGMNFSDTALASGSFFSAKNNWIQYVSRRPDGKNSKSSYVGILGFAVFTRILNKTKFPIDIGLRREAFIEPDGGGPFDGVYVKFFWPTEFKLKDQKKKRRMSTGLRVSVGTLNVVKTNKTAVLLDFWARIYINYTKNE